MRHPSILICAITLAVLGGAVLGGNVASAQILSPGASRFSPMLPPAPPPPKIEVPTIPQLDTPPPVPTVQPNPRGSFSDRISACLDEAAAAGMRPSRRAAYSRACANQ
jgi:hypothetical protein